MTTAEVVPVRILHEDGEALAVEWTAEGRIRRSVVPKRSVVGGEVKVKDLDAAPVYGDDMAAIALAALRKYFSPKKLEQIADDIAADLNSLGVWSVQDAIYLRGNVRQIVTSHLSGATSVFFDKVAEAGQPTQPEPDGTVNDDTATDSA